MTGERRPIAVVARVLRQRPRAAERGILGEDRGRPRRRARHRERPAIPGLGPPDFEVLDNGVPQHVDLVSFDQIPLNVILALDMSDSVAGDGSSSCAAPAARCSCRAEDGRSGGAGHLQPRVRLGAG